MHDVFLLSDEDIAWGTEENEKKAKTNSPGCEQRCCCRYVFFSRECELIHTSYVRTGTHAQAIRRNRAPNSAAVMAFAGEYALQGVKEDATTLLLRLPRLYPPIPHSSTHLSARTRLSFWVSFFSRRRCVTAATACLVLRHTRTHPML